MNPCSKKKLQMLKLNSVIFIVIFLISCSGSKVSGKYTSKKGLISELNFEGDHCKFTYLGMQMGGKYEVENDNIYVNAGGELGTLVIKIVSQNTLEGEGWAKGTYWKEISIEEKIAQNKQAVGKWQVTSMEVNGSTISGPDIADITWEFLEDGRTIIQTPGDPISGNWKIQKDGNISLTEGVATFHFSGKDKLEVVVVKGSKYLLSRLN